MSKGDPNNIERLNELLIQAAELFEEAGFTTPAKVPMNDAVELRWKKSGAEWDFFINTGTGERAAAGAALKVRIDAAHHLPALWAACESAQGATAHAVNEAVGKVLAFLADKRGERGITDA